MWRRLIESKTEEQHRCLLDEVAELKQNLAQKRRELLENGVIIKGFSSVNWTQMLQLDREAGKARFKLVKALGKREERESHKRYLQYQLQVCDNELEETNEEIEPLECQLEKNEEDMKTLQF